MEFKVLMLYAAVAILINGFGWIGTLKFIDRGGDKDSVVFMYVLSIGSIVGLFLLV